MVTNATAIAGTNAVSIDILKWFQAGDWASGIIFFILGALGAAIIVYLSLNTSLPGLNTSVNIRKLETEIASDKKEQEQLWKDWKKGKEESVAKQLERLDNRIEKDENRLEVEKKYLQRTSIALYIPIGAAVSTLLAADFIQAIAFGAGWTGLVSMIGITRQRGEEKVERDLDSTEVDEKNQKLEEIIKTFEKNEKTNQRSKENIDKLKKENQQLKNMIFSQTKKLKLSETKEKKDKADKLSEV